MKYYIKMTNIWTGRVLYKRNKLGNEFALVKDYCWRFSKQGAKKIIERLKEQNKFNVELKFELEPVII